MSIKVLRQASTLGKLCLMLSALCLVTMGCRRDSNVGSLPEVPLEVWVVLPGNEDIAYTKPGGRLVCLSNNTTACAPDNVSNCPWQDDDTCVVEVVGRDNFGCRLTGQEIQAYVQHLRDSNHAFGGIAFTPIVPSPRTAVDETATRPQNYTVFQTNVLADNWSAEKLNIYFVGEVRIGQDDPVGINVDPRNNPPNGRAYIAITDGGGVELSGFTTFEESPEIMRTYGVLEHEVAHNFLSRDNCGTYDSGEHAAPDPHNILSIGDYMTVELPPSEQAEIQCRVQGDTWWDSEDCCTPCTCPYRPPGCCGP